MAGRMATPRGGFYQASKWAVEAISESQYLELSSFGVRVIVVEPGSYRTDFGPRSSRRSPGEDDPKSPYAALRTKWIANASRELFPYRQEPREVVSMILHAYQDDKPFTRIPIGKDALHIIAQRDALGMDPFVEWMREVYHSDDDQ
jgi:NAD(P)-dependent dehydrogenase (short-subunit alcohol dehydrogenase family)